MGIISITPTKLSGRISVPASKSIAHRAIIASALASGVSKLDNITYSDDINATLSAIQSIGAAVESDSRTLYIEGSSFYNVKEVFIDCNESASTLRFLIPLSLLLTSSVTFTGKESLGRRPLKPYFDIFESQGVSYSKDGFPLSLQGKLTSGFYELEGSISSQFLSGLMFALPLLEGDSIISVKGELESRAYVDLTADVLRKFSIDVVESKPNTFLIKGMQKYKSTEIYIEGDYSQAAFWIIAGIIGDKIECSAMNLASLQGDRRILDIVACMNANISITENGLVARGSDTQGAVIDISQCPDLAPILAVLGAVSNGTTRIINAARLRIKECDRLKAIVTELSKLGADILEFKDSIIIHGKPMLGGGHVNSWNDHRIAMALAIASIRCQNNVFIENYEAVSKSYPEFFSDFQKLGGIINE